MPDGILETGASMDSAIYSLDFWFWAMQSQIKDYGMSSFCPWPNGVFVYHGLCSHNPMWEGVKADFDLTVEQLKEMATVVKE